MPSEVAEWSHSTDGKAVFAPNPRDLSQKMAKASKLFIRVSDFQGTAYDREFQLTGLAAVLPKVANACGWSIARK
jgi:hypothetical protein